MGGIIHKKPKEGGISAVGGTGSVYTFYPPEAPEFAKTMDSFTKKDLPCLMKNLGLKSEPLPLWWTADFINADMGQPERQLLRHPRAGHDGGHVFGQPHGPEGLGHLGEEAPLVLRGPPSPGAFVC